MLKDSQDVLSVEDVMLEYKGAQEKFAKVTVRAPWIVPNFRGLYELKHKTISLIDPPDELLEKIGAEPDVLEVNSQNGRTKITTEDRVYSQKLINRYGLLAYMDDEDNEKFNLKGVFFAADIVFTNRFIYDKDLETCVQCDGRGTGKYGRVYHRYTHESRSDSINARFSRRS